MKIDMQREFLEDFIHCYRSNRCIWDPSCPGYTDKISRQAVYNQLLHIMKKKDEDAKMHDVKRKINSLRCGYRRELHKVKLSKASGSKNIYKPSLWWFHLMDFIQTTVKMEEVNCETEINELSFSDGMADMQDVKKLKKKKLKNLEASQDYSGREIISRPMPHQQAVSHNEYEKIVGVWAVKLQKMNPQQQILAERFINEILFEGQMGTLHRNSMQLNMIECSYENYEEIEKNE